MKTIKIKKNYDFSPNSKVVLHYGSSQIHIKGFDFFDLTLNPGESVFASQLWTRSKKLLYDDIPENSFYVIKPQLDKVLAFVIFIITLICIAIFLFTRWRWSFVPLIPFVIYVLLYLSLLRNRYLKIVRLIED